MTKQISTSGGPSDGAVDVFTGVNVSALAWLAGAHKGGNVSFVATAGLTYSIRLEGEGNSTGPVQVLVQCPQCAVVRSNVTVRAGVVLGVCQCVG